MEHELLKETLISQNVIPYLEAFSGIQDHYANGKLEMAKRFFEKHNLETSNVNFIGDTVHDFEVAQGLGVKSILVANCHQSFKRLYETGITEVNDLTELVDFFHLNANNQIPVNLILDSKN